MSVQNFSSDPEELLLRNFPFDHLLNVSGLNISTISKCLPILLRISKQTTFYNNLRPIYATLQFILYNLITMNEDMPKDIFILLLNILNEIVARLISFDIVNQVLPKPMAVFEVIRHVSGLIIFDRDLAENCISILLEMLKLHKNINHSIEKRLIEIMGHLQNISAKHEIALMCEASLRIFHIDSNMYMLSSSWLMENSIKIIQNIEINESANASLLQVLVKAIYTFYYQMKEIEINKNSQFINLQQDFKQFIRNLMYISHRIIHLCAINFLERDAKMILNLIVFEFLRSNSMLSLDVERTISKEIMKFPLDLRQWPQKFNKSFIWICHVLYAHNCYVWTEKEIVRAISRPFYKSKYKKQLNISVLKSICYIYPFALRSWMCPKMICLGNDILKVAIIEYEPFLDRIMSLTQSQIIWFLSKGSKKFKCAALEFWLKKSSPYELDYLCKSLKVTNTEKLVVDVLFSNCDSFVVEKAVALVQRLQNTILIEHIQVVIPKFYGNPTMFVSLIEACNFYVPNNKTTALMLLQCFTIAAVTIDDNELLKKLYGYMTKLIVGFKKERHLVQCICNEKILIKFLILQLKLNDKQLVEETLILLTIILFFRDPSVSNTDHEIIKINLTSLLQPPTKIVIDLLFEVLDNFDIFQFESNTLIEFFYKLFDSTEKLLTYQKCFLCLTKLLDIHPVILRIPVMSTFIDNICNYSNSTNNGAYKFLLTWIEKVNGDPDKSVFVLPKKKSLKNYILESNGYKTNDVVNRYFNMIKEIYSVNFERMF